MTTVAPVIGWLVVGLAAGRIARRAADRDRDRMAGRGGAVAGPLAWDGAGVEAACALALVVLAARFGWGLPAVPYVGLVATLAAVTITDLRHYRVPDRIVAAGVAVTVVSMAAVAAAGDRPARLAWAVVGAGLLSVPLLAIHVARPTGLGRGDVKLSVLLGAGIGWSHPQRPAVVLFQLVLWALVAACGLALATAAVLRVTTGAGPTGPAGAGRRAPRPAAHIPFAPALSLATVAVVVGAGPLLR